MPDQEGIPCACRFERRESPDFSGKPPVLLDTCGFHDARAADYRKAVDEIDRLRNALRFYARSWHFDRNEPNAWDTVSGEPPNFWCDEAGTATVEDGSIAAMALRGETIDWEEDRPAPIDGETPNARHEGAP